MAEALIGLRFSHFAAAVACWGIAAFRLYALAGATRDDDAARADLDASLVRLVRLGAVIVLATAAGMLPCIVAAMAGSAEAGFAPAMLSAVLSGTEFGQVWCWHLGFAALLVITTALPRQRDFAGGVAVLALLTLASLGWIGHVAAGQGATGFAHRLNQMVHLAAGGIWAGGLLPLSLLLRRALAPHGAGFEALARTALPHFSLVGYAAVALTGAVNTALLAGSLHGLPATPYGRLLLVKLALFAAMVALALVNRFRLLPQLRGTTNAALPLRALCRSVAIEQTLGLAVLAVVAVLGTLPPAIVAG